MQPTRESLALGPYRTATQSAFGPPITPFASAKTLRNRAVDSAIVRFRTGPRTRIVDADDLELGDDVIVMIEGRA